MTGAVQLGEHGEMDCGEGIDCATLELGGYQNALLEAVIATGTPTVVVLIHGRAQNIASFDAKAAAILEAFYPGEMGGQALAEVIAGKVNPSGKLNVTIPRHAGQLPVYYNGKPETRKAVVDLPDGPQYPFGHGLSYTSFAYSGLVTNADRWKSHGIIKVRVLVTNTGPHPGREVVQLYVTDCVASILRPMRELKGFRKLLLEPGETATVTLDVSRADLSFVHHALEWRFEPGEFEFHVGGSSRTELCEKLRLG
jgi:beta-glucosidase